MSKYTWMPLDDVLDYEDVAEKHKVSEVARGPEGFLTQYKKYRKPRAMPDKWVQKRNGFIARTLVQYNKKPTYRRLLSLIMWAFMPDTLPPELATDGNE